MRAAHLTVPIIAILLTIASCNRKVSSSEDGTAAISELDSKESIDELVARRETAREARLEERKKRDAEEKVRLAEEKVLAKEAVDREKAAAALQLEKRQKLAKARKQFIGANLGTVLANGARYENAIVIAVDRSSMELRHRSGIATVAYKDLPTILQTKFLYDPGDAVER